jgi:hypothetical protein
MKRPLISFIIVSIIFIASCFVYSRVNKSELGSIEISNMRIEGTIKLIETTEKVIEAGKGLHREQAYLFNQKKYERELEMYDDELLSLEKKINYSYIKIKSSLALVILLGILTIYKGVKLLKISNKNRNNLNLGNDH